MIDVQWIMQSTIQVACERGGIRASRCRKPPLTPQGF